MSRLNRTTCSVARQFPVEPHQIVHNTSPQKAFIKVRFDLFISDIFPKNTQPEEGLLFLTIFSFATSVTLCACLLGKSRAIAPVRKKNIAYTTVGSDQDIRVGDAWHCQANSLESIGDLAVMRFGNLGVKAVRRTIPQKQVGRDNDFPPENRGQRKLTEGVDQSRV